MHDDIVLVVCGCDQGATQIMAQLFEDGYRVVGPAPNARQALALAAQTAPTLALVAGEPIGKRSAEDLADALMKTWGVKSCLIDLAGPSARERGLPAWRASHARVDALHRALNR